MRAMIWVGVVGGELLLIFIVWLAVRNWSPDVSSNLNCAIMAKTSRGNR